MINTSILAQTDFFKGLSDEGLKTLAQFCNQKNILKKEILFLEGDEGHSFYFCLRGNIRLYKSSVDGKESVIKIIKPGEIFAEVILFEQSNYPVSAIALSNASIISIPKIRFNSLLNREEFRNDFIKMLMKKQRYLADQIKYLTHFDVEERLFLFFEEQFGKKDEIATDLSKKDVASAIRTTPETLSRLLIRLEKEDRVNWNGKKIKIQWNALK